MKTRTFILTMNIEFSKWGIYNGSIIHEYSDSLFH